MELSFQQATSYLPPELRQLCRALPEHTQATCEEFRLRLGRPLFIGTTDEEQPIETDGSPKLIQPEDLRRTLELATQASFHTALEQLQNGFLPLPGGHRLGLCGTVVMREGQIVNFRTVSSLAIRIAREKIGLARPLMPLIQQQNQMENTLILAPPGAGKTTLLRDIVRELSDGTLSLRVGLADERCEVSSPYNGFPQMKVGSHTDVINGCPKHLALMILLRGMTPEVLAMDEITAPEDVDAILTAVGCGVRLLATAHGERVADLERRPLYRRLLEEHIFHRVIGIKFCGGIRSYQVEELA